MRGDREAHLGYRGAALLFVALFLPSIYERSGGSVNYFANGWVASAVLLLAIAGSCAASSTRRYWLLWLTGGAALALTSLTLWRAALAGVARLGWGWPILITGALLVLAAAEIGRRNGARAPRRFWGVAVAGALLAVAVVVVGPRLLSLTRRAAISHEVTIRQAERALWQPHDFTRVLMEATRDHARERAALALARLDQERLAAALAERQAARARSASKVRRLADVRRWYPAFADGMRPVLEARRGFLGSYRAGGLDAARPFCDAIEQRASRALVGLPRSPDPALQGQTTRLLDLYLGSAEACRSEDPVAVALDQLDRAEERIGAQLEELADSLGSYCLRLPAGGPGWIDSPAAIDACSTRDRIASLEGAQSSERALSTATSTARR